MQSRCRANTILNGKKLVNLLPTSQNILIFPQKVFPPLCWFMGVTFSRLNFQVFPRSYKQWSGAAPTGIYLHPPPKHPPDRGFAVKAKMILSSPSHPSTWGQNSKSLLWILTLPCYWNHQPLSQKTQRPIQIQWGYFNCSNAASNLKFTLTSYKEVLKMCTAAQKKNVSISMYLCSPLQISAGTNECRILPPSLSFFFFLHNLK